MEQSEKIKLKIWEALFRSLEVQYNCKITYELFDENGVLLKHQKSTDI